jgi:hypothetical protein
MLNPTRTRSPLRTIAFFGGVDISCAATGQTEKKSNAVMSLILNMALPDHLTLTRKLAFRP